MTLEEQAIEIAKGSIGNLSKDELLKPQITVWVHFKEHEFNVSFDKEQRGSLGDVWVPTGVFQII